MSDDTDIGGKMVAFPETPLSAILAARSDDPVSRARGFSMLVAAYWKPAYKAIRRRFRKTNEEAKDLTQSFFTEALARELFDVFEPERGRFRTFIRVCLRNFVSKSEQTDKRIKRGGGWQRLSLDFNEAEGELEHELQQEMSFEEAFDRDLAKSLATLATDALRSHLQSKGKGHYFELFSRYDLVDEAERPTYAELAEAFDVKTTDVTNRLAYTRKLYRGFVLERLREVTANEAEFREEALHLLGVDPVDPL